MKIKEQLVLSTEDSRHKIKEIANNQQTIYGITPFGLSQQIKEPQYQIVREQENASKYSITRTNKSIHAKILLTKDYVMHGSCNFTENSIQNEHEIIQVTPKKGYEKQYRKFKQFFETVWRRSQKTQEERATSRFSR